MWLVQVQVLDWLGVHENNIINFVVYMYAVDKI